MSKSTGWPHHVEFNVDSEVDSEVHGQGCFYAVAKKTEIPEISISESWRAKVSCSAFRKCHQEIYRLKTLTDWST
jgi:hypothetical protein